MNLRELSERITLESTLATAVETYRNLNQFRRQIVGYTFIIGYAPTCSPEQNDEYVISTGSLRTTVTDMKVIRELRHRYPHGLVIKEEDLPDMERNNVYFSPEEIRRRDRSLIWQRNDTDW